MLLSRHRSYRRQSDTAPRLLYGTCLRTIAEIMAVLGQHPLFGWHNYLVLDNLMCYLHTACGQLPPPRPRAPAVDRGHRSRSLLRSAHARRPRPGRCYLRSARCCSPTWAGRAWHAWHFVTPRQCDTAHPVTGLTCDNCDTLWHFVTRTLRTADPR